jgi:hypothetical protein
MAQDISNKINEATNDIILQGKDIRNRIVSAENDIKKHINEVEECILEALDSLRIDDIGGSGAGSEDITVNAILEKNIFADVTIGGISEGATIDAGTTFTQFVERLFTVIKAGIVSDPVMEGYAIISEPIIKVSILDEDGNYSVISSGAIIKENSKLKIEIEIPISETKNTNSKIKETNTVLAYGYIKKIDDTIDTLSGIDDCEIGTKIVSEGNDCVNIVSKNGCFSSFDITDGTTKIITYLSDVNEDGSLQVKSVSKTYKVLSDSNYTIYAKSNKDESLEEIANTPNRVKIINKDSQIGENLSDDAVSEVFTIEIEKWGVIPKELNTEGTVIINAPEIKVTKLDGTIVNSGDKLSPYDEIIVDVSLNGKSSIDNPLVYLLKTANTFQYGWEKIRNDEVELVKDPSNNQNCVIGYTLSDDTDTTDRLLFSGTPTGVFENMKIDTDKNKISFGPTNVGNFSNNSFSVLAESGTHKILSDANYQITALSNIYSADENNSKTNRLIITKNEILKKFNSKISEISSFNFEIFEETQKELFYKIVEQTDKIPQITTLIDVEKEYNIFTENNLINDLGFTKYTKNDADVLTISGGYCIILTKLTVSELELRDGKDDLNELGVITSKPTIGGYNFYNIDIGGNSTYTLKIK